MAGYRMQCIKHNHQRRISFLWTLWLILPYLDERRFITGRWASRIHDRWCFWHEERECQIEGYAPPWHYHLAYKLAVWLDNLGN